MTIFNKTDKEITELFNVVFPHTGISEFRYDRRFKEPEIYFEFEYSGSTLNATRMMRIIAAFGTSNIELEPMIFYGGYCDTCSYESGGYRMVVRPENDPKLFASAKAFLETMDKEQ